MPKGRHRHPNTLSAPIGEWIRDTWLTIWHSLTGTPMPQTVKATTTVAAPFNADK
jgi:hypothetical protein